MLHACWAMAATWRSSSAAGIDSLHARTSSAVGMDGRWRVLSAHTATAANSPGSSDPLMNISMRSAVAIEVQIMFRGRGDPLRSPGQAQGTAPYESLSDSL
jgi:hypothetical protein